MTPQSEGNLLKEGDRVQIKTEDGEFQGVVHTLDNENDKIVLSKVVSVASGKKFYGIQCFFGHEITCITPLVKDKDKAKDEKHSGAISKYEVKRTLPSNANGYISQLPPLPKLQVKCDVTGVQEADSSDSEEIDATNNTPKPHKRPKESYFIQKLDKQFYQVIKFLKSETIIGLSVKGIDIGRRGKLCLLLIGTKEYVFLFDVLTLGRDFFDEGLKEVLECSTILKVVHDCRQLSDCLFHQYLVKLENVFDTQVADAMVYKLINCGNYPRNVRSLSACLMEYLALSHADVYFPHVRVQMCQDDQAMWKERPLPDELRKAAEKDVVYLRELRLAIIEQLHSELVCGTEIYMSELRDRRDEELARFESHVLPKAFQQLVDNTSRRRTRNAFSYTRQEGFHSNHIRVMDPDIYFSRDSWHTVFDNDMYTANMANYRKNQRPLVNGNKKDATEDADEQKASEETGTTESRENDFEESSATESSYLPKEEDLTVPVEKRSFPPEIIRKPKGTYEKDKRPEQKEDKIAFPVSRPLIVPAGMIITNPHQRTLKPKPGPIRTYEKPTVSNRPTSSSLSSTFNVEPAPTDFTLIGHLAKRCSNPRKDARRSLPIPKTLMESFQQPQREMCGIGRAGMYHFPRS